MILLRVWEQKAFSHHSHPLLHHRQHLLQWHNRPETHLQMQRDRLLATCWAKPLALRPCKVLRELLQLQVLVLSLGQRVDRLGW